MNTLPMSQKTAILQALVEGCSIRSTERLTGSHRDTIMRLLIRAGRKSEMLLDSIKGIQAEHIQIDEAWTFVGKKNNRLADEEMSNKKIGTQFVFVAMDRKTKLIPTFTGRFCNDYKNGDVWKSACESNINITYRTPGI